MKDEIFREPLECSGRLCVYTWTQHSLFQMQWLYSIEWTEGAKFPKIWIMSYRCMQRETPDAPFREVDQIPFDVPMSEAILSLLAEHAGKELFRRSLVVGSLKPVPQNFLVRAEESAAKGGSLRLLRETSQQQESATTPG
jgi:hypothetical protein